MASINLINDARLRKVLEEYFNLEKIVSVTPYGKSFINEKYLIKLNDCEYVLQKINDQIYNSPFSVVHNIDLVTSVIKAKLISRGDDYYRALVCPIENQYGELMTIVDDAYWRCTSNIENSTVFYEVKNEKMMTSIGKLVGSFQNMLEGFNCKVLDTNILNIHNLHSLYQSLMEVYKLNPAGRSGNCLSEIKAIKQRKHCLTLITDRLNKGEIPYRVNHNGTSISEIVFDKETNEALTYLNMDALMRGSAGNDIGNALRACAAYYTKDEEEDYKANINYDYIDACLKGYFAYTKDILSENEKNSLYDNFYTVILENAIISLKEYLEGNHLASIDYEDQNIDRCRMQLSLLKEVEKNEERIKALFNKYSF